MRDEEIRLMMVDGYWSGWDNKEVKSAAEFDFARAERLNKVLLESHKKVAKAAEQETLRRVAFCLAHDCKFISKYHGRCTLSGCTWSDVYREQWFNNIVEKHQRGGKNE